MPHFNLTEVKFECSHVIEIRRQQYVFSQRIRMPIEKACATTECPQFTYRNPWSVPDGSLKFSNVSHLVGREIRNRTRKTFFEDKQDREARNNRMEK